MKDYLITFKKDLKSIQGMRKGLIKRFESEIQIIEKITRVSMDFLLDETFIFYIPFILFNFIEIFNTIYIIFLWSD